MERKKQDFQNSVPLRWEFQMKSTCDDVQPNGKKGKKYDFQDSVSLR